MKIIFIGTADFAAKNLEFLINNDITILSVISQPDKPQGRKLKITPSSVSETALHYKLPLLKPTDISSPETIKTLKSLSPDLIIVVAYGQILKEQVLNIPKKGAINVHASLLPKYRGAAPIQRTIINGEKETGITIMFMDKDLDSGDIISQEKTTIKPEETYGSLHNTLLELSNQLLLKTISDIENNQISRTPQNHLKASYAKKITKKECLINWNLPAKTIHNLIRGLNPSPLAYTQIKLKEKTIPLKIWKTSIVEHSSSLPPGSVITLSKDELIIKTQTSGLRIEELQLPGKKKIATKNFLHGYALTKESFLVT